MLFGGVGGLSSRAARSRVRRCGPINRRWRLPTSASAASLPGTSSATWATQPIRVSLGRDANGLNSIAVEFSALDYSAPERNRYSYRLDGFDSAWIDTEASTSGRRLYEPAAREISRCACAVRIGTACGLRKL